jgi:hypothetical protein
MKNCHKDYHRWTRRESPIKDIDIVLIFVIWYESKSSFTVAGIYPSFLLFMVRYYDS